MRSMAAQMDGHYPVQDVGRMGIQYVSVSAQEQLQRQTARQEWADAQNFYLHPVWNRGGRTND